jgi:hypothetical protein
MKVDFWIVEWEGVAVFMLLRMGTSECSDKSSDFRKGETFFGELRVLLVSQEGPYSVELVCVGLLWFFADSDLPPNLEQKVIRNGKTLIVTELAVFVFETLAILHFVSSCSCGRAGVLS